MFSTTLCEFKMFFFDGKKRRHVVRLNHLTEKKEKNPLYDVFQVKGVCFAQNLIPCLRGGERSINLIQNKELSTRGIRGRSQE